jgi:transposase
VRPGQVAALDPFRGYERALHARLPDADVVLDAFHAIRLAQDAIDRVRRRVQQDTHGHRGRKGDPLYGIRRVLLRGAENLTARLTPG